MNVFRLLKYGNLLLWLMSAFKSAAVALLVALLFGFTTNGWLSWPAFWGFWLPCLGVSLVYTIKNTRALSPYDDVFNAFSGQASAKQKQRAMKAIADSFDEDDNSDTEIEEVMLIDWEKTADTLVQLELVDSIETVFSSLKVVANEYDIAMSEVDLESVLEHLLEDHLITLDAEFDDVEQAYFAFLAKLQQHIPTFIKEVTECEWEQSNHLMHITLHTSEGEEKWHFKQYNHDQISDNFIIHIALKLKEQTDFELLYLDFDSEYHSQAILVKKPVAMKVHSHQLIQTRELVA